MRTSQPQEPCASKCAFIAMDRNRYFTGKYMTARDFQDDQTYFVSRHRLHNRVLHGWGIVCGLRVVHHPDPGCRDRWVVVRAGIALDCCGRELILPKDTAFELPLPRSSAQQRQEPRPDKEAMHGPFLLCLRYDEQEIEHVPALYTEGTCDPTRREANRVREGACLVVLDLDEVEPDCWKAPGGGMDVRCRDDCDEELPGPAGACLEPDCPCGHTVPLAVIRFRPEALDRGFEIDTLGRRQMPTPPEFLTHIVGTNWPHGGVVTPSQLREPEKEGGMGGRLAVRFDRRLLPADGERTGINEFTFTVQYGGAQRDLEFLPYPRTRERSYPPTLEEDGCLAVYAIDPGFIGEPDALVGEMVYVTLRCDFILDCHENPVDGDHLRGRLPSGNGVPGGVFESWFRVSSEGREYEEAK